MCGLCQVSLRCPLHFPGSSRHTKILGGSGNNKIHGLFPQGDGTWVGLTATALTSKLRTASPLLGAQGVYVLFVAGGCWRLSLQAPQAASPVREVRKGPPRHCLLSTSRMLRQALGSAWCCAISTNPLEGKWAPQECLDNAAEPAEPQHRAPPP